MVALIFLLCVCSLWTKMYPVKFKSEYNKYMPRGWKKCSKGISNWVKKLGTVLVTSWQLFWILQERGKDSCKNPLSISTPNMVQGGPKCKSGTQFAKSYKVRAHPTAYRPVWETSIFHTNGCWSNRKSRLITLFWREQILKDFSTKMKVFMYYLTADSFILYHSFKIISIIFLQYIFI